MSIRLIYQASVYRTIGPLVLISTKLNYFVFFSMKLTLLGRNAVAKFWNVMSKVRSMQRSEPEAIRTQIQPSKPKREITNITNSQNTKENIIESRHEKTNILHMQKQRRRSSVAQ